MPAPATWLLPLVHVATGGAIEVDTGTTWRAFHADGTLADAMDRSFSMPTVLANDVELGKDKVVVAGREVPLDGPMRGALPDGDAVWVRLPDAFVRIGARSETRVAAPKAGGFALLDGGGYAWSDADGLHVRGKGRGCDVPGLAPGGVSAWPDRVAWTGLDRFLVVDGRCRPVAALPVRADALGFGADRIVRWTDHEVIIHDPVTLAVRTPPKASTGVGTWPSGADLVLVHDGRSWDPVTGRSEAAPPLPQKPHGVRALGPGAAGLRPVPGGLQAFRDGRDVGPVLPVRTTLGAASPDGRFAATLIAGEVTLWEVATGQARWTAAVPGAKEVSGVDARRVAVFADGLRILRTVDGAPWAHVLGVRAGERALALAVTPPGGPAWDSRRPLEHRLPALPAADAPSPDPGPPLVDRLAQAFDRDLDAVLASRASCEHAPGLADRWDAFPGLDAPVEATLRDRCVGLDLARPWSAPGPGVPLPSPPLGPPGPPVPAVVPLRTDVPTVLARFAPSGVLALAELIAAHVPVYWAGVTADIDDEPVPDLEALAPVAQTLALPQVLPVLDDLGVDAVLVDPGGHVRAAGSAADVVASTWLLLAGPTRPVPAAWATPTLALALRDTVVELRALGDDVLVRTGGEVARVGPDLRARWQVAGRFRSMVVDGERVWVEAFGQRAFAVGLGDGRRGETGGLGQAIPGTPTRFWAERSGRSGPREVRDVDGVVLSGGELTQAAELVGDHLEVAVGPFRAELGLDGAFRRFLPAAPPAALRETEAGAVVDARGRVILTKGRGLRPFGARGWIVQAGGTYGPWLLLDDQGRIRAALDAQRVEPVGDALVGATRRGLARWEGPW